jgi:hypothetical protein
VACAMHSRRRDNSRGEGHCRAPLRDIDGANDEHRRPAGAIQGQDGLTVIGCKGRLPRLRRFTGRSKHSMLSRPGSARVAVILYSCVALLAACVGTAWATAGNLDPSFGSGDIFTVGPGRSFGVARQPDAVSETHIPTRRGSS